MWYDSQNALLSSKLYKLFRNNDLSSTLLLTSWTCCQHSCKSHWHHFKYFMWYKCLWKRLNCCLTDNDLSLIMEEKGKDNREAGLCPLQSIISLHTSWVPSLGPPVAAWWHLAPCRGCWPSPASSHNAPGYPEHAWKNRQNAGMQEMSKSSEQRAMCLLFTFTHPFRFSLGAHLSSSRLRRISSSSSLWIQVPSLLIFSKCFFTSSLHSDCNAVRQHCQMI